MPSLITDSSAGGYRFFYTDEDAAGGPPVLMVHSSGMSAQQWRKLRAALLPTHRVILPDLIGYGQSDALREPFDASQDLAGLEALLRQVAAERAVHLVGHSYGGFLALRLARRAPLLLASLTLFEPVLYGALWSSGDEEGRADLKGMMDEPTFLDPAHGGSDAWLERFVDYWNGPGAWARMTPAARGFMQTTGRKVFHEVSAVSATDVGFADFAGLGQQVPTLLVRGAATNPGARRVVEALAPLLPAQVAIIPGAGHNSPLTHADQALSVLLPHLRGAEAQGRRHDS